MILTSDIIERVAADLDAEGSDRYTFDNDYKPAINKSIVWATNVLSGAFSQTRQIADKLSDLKKTRIFQTSGYSRVALNNHLSGEKVWTVLAVIVNPVYHPDWKTPATFANPAVSVCRTDMSYISGGEPASRATEEEFTEGADNVFMRGSTASLSDKLKTYVWLEDHDYNSSNYESSDELPEITIRPDLKNSFVAIRFLKTPNQVDDEADLIEFPDSMIDIISTKTLNFISRKMGDQTSTYAVSKSDIAEMISVLR